MMKHYLPVVALVLAVAIHSEFAHGEQSPSTATPSLSDAQAKLRANDPAAAVQELEQIVKQAPTEVAAWRLLGIAAQRAKDLDRALEAYRRVLALQPGSAQTIYNMGSAYAMKGDKDAAFEWLFKAKAGRQVDMTQIDADADLQSLRIDPRFRRLRPVLADFENPFVEPVTILREWRGESANEQFGWMARNIGDVDGDRVPDFVTSSPTKASSGPNTGRIYVYSTGASSLLWSADGQPGDRLGIGIERAGDVNRDGTPDVVAGAPGGGYAKVYSGKDGTALLTLRAEDPADAYGRHTSGIGDIDKDGHDDLIVGAPNNDAAGANAGRAYVYSGRDGKVLLTLTGERAGDTFGSEVSGATDGQSSLIVVGAPSAGATNRGRAYVFEGLSTTPKFVIEADETGSSLAGMFVSVPGDVDGDGGADVYASDFSNAAKGPATGRIVVHSGKNGRRVLTLTGETAGEGFGTSSSIAGDVNRDGHADLIVGAWQYAGSATSGGRAYLYSGKDGALLRTLTCRIPGDTFGFDANEIGDVDGDDTTDFLITSAWSGVNGFHSGRVFVVSGAVPGPRARR
jgi:hypothetical protein